MTTISVSRDAPTADAVRAPARRAAARRLGVCALVIAAGIGAAWYGTTWWTSGRFIETTDDAYVGGDITAISPHVAGFVTDIAVADNQHVQAGQLLARLDTRDYRAALDRAQAQVEMRVAALASLRAQAQRQQSAILQAAAEWQARIARAAFTRIDSARYATLAVTSAGSRQEAQRSRVADQEAQSAADAARAGLQAAHQQASVLDADIAAARAEEAQARAELRRASLDLGYTEIRAPIEGYVGNRAAHLGAYVSEGAYLLSVIPARGLWVDANFKEDQLARMAQGQAVTLTADAVPGTVLHGRVLSLAPGTGAMFSVIPPENATGNFTRIVQRVPVRIALDADTATLGRLRPGLTVTASVDTKPAP